MGESNAAGLEVPQYAVASNFSLENRIASGGFSSVYTAKSLCDDYTVAIKKIDHKVDVEKQADCIRELDRLKNLQHPNVIRHLASFVDSHRQLCLVLVLADRGDLSHIIEDFSKNKRIIPERTIWIYFVQICSGLDHMHSNGLMHGELKPGNVFITPQGVAKLGGLSLECNCRTVAAHFLEHPVLSTYNKATEEMFYWAPEKLHGRGFTCKSDIWALGCILYTMATLRSPFNDCGMTMHMSRLYFKIARGIYTPLSEDAWTDTLRWVVSTCIQGDPELRPLAGDVYQVSQNMHQYFLEQKEQAEEPTAMEQHGGGSMIFQRDGQSPPKRGAEAFWPENPVKMRKMSPDR